MNVLVTGGMGYIGSHTCVRMIESGMNPIILDNLCNSSPIVLERIKALTGKTPKFYEGDILDSALLEKIFAENDIKSVIHFAGLKAVGESVAKPVEYYENNVSGTLNLVKAMKKADVKSIIFSSSATVYGDPESLPLTEESKTGGTTNPYGTSKYMVELCLKDLQKAEPDWSITLLRYFNPVGAHESGTMGEDPKGIPNNLMPFVAQVAVGRRECLSVFGDDYNTKDGTGVRDYIHVIDLADGHIAALNVVGLKDGLHIYNLGTGNGSTVLEVVAAFSKACGKDVAYKICERRPGDVAACYAGTDKAAKELNWKATRTIEDMTADTWRWQSANPNGYEG